MSKAAKGIDVEALKGQAAYPQRAPYFAHRVCRLLTKTCAAQDIGHIAFVLCVTIAHQEDAKRYKGAVTFFNEQLMPLVGVTKWESLDRARQRAVAAGWLHYSPGDRGKREPGRYWVTIPAHLEDLPDAPCDEKQYPANGDRQAKAYPANGDREGEREGERRGDREGEHSILSLDPNPSPEKMPACAGGPPAGLLQLIDGWNGLGAGIVMRGNGARRDPPAKEILNGWNRATRNAEQREAFQDIPAVLTAIRGATFCHGQGWFTLPWLFGKNKNGEANICRLLAGAHNGVGQNGNARKQSMPTGPGQRHPADTAERSRTGVF